MINTLKQHIESSSDLIQTDQIDFLDKLTDLIKINNLRATGKIDSGYPELNNRSKDSQSHKTRIIEIIGDFVIEKDDLIPNIKIR